MAKLLYSNKPNAGARPDDACLMPPPEYQECCIDPCAEPIKCCPPKTKVRNALIMYNNEAGRCFSLSGKGCGNTSMPVLTSCIKMTVRRYGECNIRATVQPFRMNPDGSICFRWTQEFLNMPQGYYEADIIVDEKCCNVVCLYFPPCIGRPTTTEVITEDACATDVPCECDVLEVDQSPAPTPQTECPTC